MKKVLIIFLLSSFFSLLHSQTIRPVRDNVGFCWDATEMDAFIEYLTQNADTSVESSSANLVGGISVHDDYLYAGRVYFPLFNKIRTKEVVIFGVTHGTVRKEMNNLKDVIILDEFDKWQGPYGAVSISPLRELIKDQLPPDDYLISNKAQAIEHSIEAFIPFLQHYNRNIKITPIMIPQMSFERMKDVSDKLSKIISNYITENKLIPGKDIFFLISNDADHYGEDFNNSPFGTTEQSHREATDIDRKIISEDLTGKFDFNKLKKFTDDIWPDSLNPAPKPLWCGRYPIVFGLMAIDFVMNAYNAKGIRGTLFKYSDTFTEKVLPIKTTSMGVTAVFSLKHWCGFFTMGLYPGQ